MSLDQADLWEQAWNRLSAQEPKLVEKYTELLERNASSASSNLANPLEGKARQQELATSLALKITAIDEDDSSLRKASLFARESINKIIGVVSWSKDFVGSALSAEPHAAMAWAGVCLLLPLLLNHAEEKTAALEGLAEVAVLLKAYSIKARTYKAQPLATDARDSMISLFCNILKFQIQLLRQYSRYGIVRYARGVLRAGGWAAMMAEIRASDQACTRLMGHVDTEIVLNNWKQQLGIVQQQYAVQSQLLHIAQRTADHATEKLFDDCIQTFKTTQYEDDKDVNPQRVPNTCRWLVENPTFKSWTAQTRIKIMWISAGPGVGKSVLSKLLIDDRNATGRPSEAMYFFFKDGLDKRQSANHALCALIHQILSKRRSLTQYAIDAVRNNGPKITDSFSSLWYIFCSLCCQQSLAGWDCILDAFDEADEQSQAFLTDHLAALVHDPNCQVRFIFTSRKYVMLTRYFAPLLNSRQAINIDADDASAGQNISDAIAQEINLVIQSRVNDLGAQIRLRPEVTSFLIFHLQSIRNRTYLWLHLIFGEIKRSIGFTDQEDMAALIHKLPKTVDDAYESVLKRSHDHDGATILLHIILAARRPLTLDELNLAFAVHKRDDKIPGSTPLRLMAAESFKEYATNACGLFIHLVGPKVHLLHETARVFLTAREPRPPVAGTWKNSMRREESHSILGSICVKYIYNDFYGKKYYLGEIKSKPAEGTQITAPDLWSDLSHLSIAPNPPPTTAQQIYTNPYASYDPFAATNRPTTRPTTTTSSVMSPTTEPPFSFNSQLDRPDEEQETIYTESEGEATLVRYCATYWTYHIQRSDHFNSPFLLTSNYDVIRTIKEAGHVCAVQDRWYSIWEESTPYWHPKMGADAIVVAAFFNLNDIVVRLLQSRLASDINAHDAENITALAWSSVNGNAELTELLLRHPEINPNPRSSKGFTPLMFAAEHGHVDVARHLLRHKDTDTDATAMGWSALRLAYNNERPEIIALLLDPHLNKQYSSPALFQECLELREIPLPWLEEEHGRWVANALERKIALMFD